MQLDGKIVKDVNAKMDEITALVRSDVLTGCGEFAPNEDAAAMAAIMVLLVTAEKLALDFEHEQKLYDAMRVIQGKMRKAKRAKHRLFLFSGDLGRARKLHKREKQKELFNEK
jgi:hypothetical protein